MQHSYEVNQTKISYPPDTRKFGKFCVLNGWSLLHNTGKYWNWLAYWQLLYEYLLVRIQRFLDNSVTKWKQTMLRSYLPVKMSREKSFSYTNLSIILNLMSLVFSIRALLKCWIIVIYSYVFVLYLISLFTQRVKMGRGFFVVDSSGSFI